jgi:hypothetical protein
MKSAQELYNERTERLKKVLALEKTDRTPVIYMADSFCAVHVGEKISELVSSLKNANRIMLKSYQEMGDVDGANFPFCPGPLFPMAFYSKVKLPGRELPDDSLWQLDEREVMTVEDYDTILNKGWQSFSVNYLKNRLDFPLEAIMKETEEIPGLIKNFTDAGYMVYSPIAPTTVNEFLAGGRSMPKFMRDLFKMPDKVEAVLDIIQKESLDILRQQVRAIKPMVVFMSPARGASEFFSPKIWERFVWKYLKQMADVIIEEGAVANIHADGNWERDLAYFRDFPKGKLVFESDGGTNIYKAKEVLGDRVCLKGDVGATLLTLGNPDEVYNYCTKLISDMGTGFILSAGCTVPPNAKVENVKAMISAATGK